MIKLLDRMVEVCNVELLGFSLLLRKAGKPGPLNHASWRTRHSPHPEVFRESKDAPQDL